MNEGKVIIVTTVLSRRKQMGIGRVLVTEKIAKIKVCDTRVSDIFT